MKTLILSFLLLAPHINSENITIFGIGRLGICQALCYEHAGYNVLGVDLSTDYIAAVNAKTLISNEPLVMDFLQASKNFRGTTSVKEGIDFSDIYIISVPTNFITGSATYDYSILTELLTKINSYAAPNKHIVISSTIAPGYIRDVARNILKNCPNATISYNPAFIAQGEIMNGFLYPDIVLIGEGSPEIGTILSSIYEKIVPKSSYFARMSADSAEITKLALNCFITAKIAFANLIGDIADETPGADKTAILKALGNDQRIGGLYLKPGYGFGGPCFPRDNRAFGGYAKSMGFDSSFFEITDKNNMQHADYMAKKFLDMNLPEYIFDDVCYKSKCPVPIIEESQKLVVAKKIANAGKKVVIKDRRQVIGKVNEDFGDMFEYVFED